MDAPLDIEEPRTVLEVLASLEACRVRLEAVHKVFLGEHAVHALRIELHHERRLLKLLDRFARAEGPSVWERVKAARGWRSNE